MSFAVAAESYDRFMGRFSTQLAAPFADFAGVSSGQRVLDVGCGPGALTAELVERLGADSVTAIDPSDSFVAAARDRHPGVQVELGAAEQLPFADGEFDAALAQLVVHFMNDPVAGVREAGRVTRDGGVVAACVWDHGGGRGPLSLFWEAAHTVELGAAEQLPFADGEFDAALAQLVVHFMNDPVAGVREAGRVTRAGGVVAACVWDHGGGRGPLSLFWEAARAVDPALTDESELVGTRAGQLGELFAAAGLQDVDEAALAVGTEYSSFEEWWEPYTLGVGPAGGYVSRLDAETRDRIRQACRASLPAAPFTIEAYAWAARAPSG